MSPPSPVARVIHVDLHKHANVLASQRFGDTFLPQVFSHVQLCAIGTPVVVLFILGESGSPPCIPVGSPDGVALPQVVFNSQVGNHDGIIGKVRLQRRKLARRDFLLLA